MSSSNLSSERFGVQTTGKKGAFGGYGDWIDRAGRYRFSDGQIDFKPFLLAIEYGCDVWADGMECCIKSPEQGAEKELLSNHTSSKPLKNFDDFAGTEIDEDHLKNSKPIIQTNETFTEGFNTANKIFTKKEPPCDRQKRLNILS